ncbi:hypothetical protein GGR56DRAFT_672357 [Xylariaceae sp. FL0804]|nr:hypothetical protein GGR56DRAFT_672357 [Xylariaceae sp. FL0804]
MKITKSEIACASSLIFSSCLFIYSRFFYISDWRCLNQLYPYSPALPQVKYEMINYADWYYPFSPFRGDPSRKPEVEQVWSGYTFDGVVSVPYEKLSQFGLPPSFEPWPLGPIEGGGVAAVPSVFYHTNCLNLLRKYVHRETYDYTYEAIFDPSRTDPSKLRAQVHQCVEVIRQELVCHMDLSVYLLWPDPKQRVPFNEDNAVQHRCRNYEDLHEWAEANRVRDLHNATMVFDNLYFPKIARYLP